MLTNVVHHDVHATELGPHLQANTEDNTLEHSWFKEDLVAGVRLFAFDSQGFLNLAVLGKDFGVVDIAVSVEPSEDLDGLFPTVFACQPTGGLGEEEETDKEDDARHDLNAPGNAERGGALGRVIRAAIDVAGSILLDLCQ